MRVGKLKNGNVAGKDEITEEMIKGLSDIVVDWIWRLCNMVFESGFMTGDWRTAAIAPLYKSKGERTEWKNYRGISFLSLIGKIYAGVGLVMNKGVLERGYGV